MGENALPTARTVLLWSSYATNAKPLDFPVPLSRTRFTSTTSPYLRKVRNSSDLAAAAIPWGGEGREGKGKRGRHAVRGAGVCNLLREDGEEVAL
jgi:hypothetical protein